ncbi:hypothetical protein ACLOJK_027717 [Asimina triloba]
MVVTNHAKAEPISVESTATYWTPAPNRKLPIVDSRDPLQHSTRCDGQLASSPRRSIVDDEFTGSSSQPKPFKLAANTPQQQGILSTIKRGCWER